MEQVKNFLKSYKMKGNDDDTTTIINDSEFIGYGYKIDKTPFDEDFIRPEIKIKLWIERKVSEEDAMLMVLVHPKDTINIYTPNSKLIAYIKIVSQHHNRSNMWAILFLNKEYFKLT